MKKIAIMSFLLNVFFVHYLYAQPSPNADPGSNGATWSAAQIDINEEATLTITAGNYGSDPIPANSTDWIVSLPPNVEFIEFVNLPATPFSIFSQDPYDPINGTTITLRNAADIPVSIPGDDAIWDVIVKVKGSVQSAPASAYGGMNISPDPLLVGNTNPSNDNPTSPIIVTGTVLPVQLTTFSAQEKSCGIVGFSWVTASEVNVSRFDVEYSPDSRHFRTIYSTKAQNNITGASYNATVKQVEKTGFYRLKMTDVDNSYAYSKTEQINLNCKTLNISVSPNPAKDVVNISSLKGAELIRIFNVNGQLVLEQHVQTDVNVAHINIVKLPNGIYNLVVLDDNVVTASFKVVKN